MNPLFWPCLCHVPDNSETISRNLSLSLRFMSLTFAWGGASIRCGTAYFPLATAGFPLAEGFVPVRRRLVLAGFTGEPPKRCMDFGYRHVNLARGSREQFFYVGDFLDCQRVFPAHTKELSKK